MSDNSKNIPKNIKNLLEIDMMHWNYEQMQEFSNWQAETNTYPGPMQDNRGPQPLSCFWQERGIMVNNCH